MHACSGAPGPLLKNKKHDFPLAGFGGDTRKIDQTTLEWVMLECLPARNPGKAQWDWCVYLELPSKCRYTNLDTWSVWVLKSQRKRHVLSRVFGTCWNPQTRSQKLSLVGYEMSNFFRD